MGAIEDPAVIQLKYITHLSACLRCDGVEEIQHIVIHGTISTTDVREIVLASLRSLEGDAVHAAAIKGVREAWVQFHEAQHRSPLGGGGTRSGSIAEGTRGLAPLAVPVRSGKSHSTIWGKTAKCLEDIPDPARELLRRITCVEGISEIRLTAMSKGPKAMAGRVRLQASKTSGVIDGQVYDHGPKGDVQCFQIRLHDPRRTPEILVQVQEALRQIKALA